MREAAGPDGDLHQRPGAPPVWVFEMSDDRVPSAPSAVDSALEMLKWRFAWFCYTSHVAMGPSIILTRVHRTGHKRQATDTETHLVQGILGEHHFLLKGWSPHTSHHTDYHPRPKVGARDADTNTAHTTKYFGGDLASAVAAHSLTQPAASTHPARQSGARPHRCVPMRDRRVPRGH